MRYKMIWHVVGYIHIYVCVCFISVLLKLMFRWYYGDISRARAEELLMDPVNKRGAFLIRDSQSSHKYSLSVKVRYKTMPTSHLNKELTITALCPAHCMYNLLHLFVRPTFIAATRTDKSSRFDILAEIMNVSDGENRFSLSVTVKTENNNHHCPTVYIKIIIFKDFYITD